MKEIDPIRQAESEMPYNLIMRALIWRPKLALAITCISIYELLYHLVPNDTFSHFVGGGVYLLGTLADNLSTIKDLDLNNELERLGKGRMSYEGNPVFGKQVKTSKDFLTNKRHLAGELIGGSISILNPLAGVYFGMIRSLAAYNNSQLSKRADRAIKIIKEGNR